MRRPSRFQLSLRAALLGISIICLTLALWRALDFSLHQLVAIAAVSGVVIFLAYQATMLLLDIAQDLTDAINGDHKPSNRR